MIERALEFPPLGGEQLAGLLDVLQRSPRRYSAYHVDQSSTGSTSPWRSWENTRDQLRSLCSIPWSLCLELTAAAADVPEGTFCYSVAACCSRSSAQCSRARIGRCAPMACKPGKPFGWDIAPRAGSGDETIWGCATTSAAVA